MARVACLTTIAAGVAAALLLPAGVLRAQEVKLPTTLTFTAYDTGSSGFNIAVAVGKSLKDKNGTDVRVLPAGNDVARLAPLRAERAQASAMGIGSYFAQEGVFEFAVKEWGPQPLRLILSVDRLQRPSRSASPRTPACKEVKDLRGKRDRHGGRLARAQPERLRRAGVRRPDSQRREAGRVLQLRRHVEGHGQQRGRRGHRLQHLGPGQGGRDLAARHRLPADAGRRQGRLGAAQQDRPLLPPAHVDVRLGRARRRLGRAAGLPLSDLHGLCLAAGRPRLQSRQGDDRQLRRLQGCGARRRRPRAQAPEPGVGAALPRGRRAGAEGGGRVEGRARGAQPGAA